MGSPSGGVEYGHYTGKWRPGESREVSGCEWGEREGGGGMEGRKEGMEMEEGGGIEGGRKERAKESKTDLSLPFY